MYQVYNRKYEISNLLKWTYYFYVYLKLFSFFPSLSSLSHRISKPENQIRNSFKTHSKKNKSDPKDLFRLCSVQVKQYFRFAITQWPGGIYRGHGIEWRLNWTVETTESGRSYKGHDQFPWRPSTFPDGLNQASTDGLRLPGGSTSVHE